MPLETATDSDLWKLADAIFAQFKNRDEVWKNRRNVRYRRMENDLRSLPLNSRVSNTALLVHQTELPNQDCHRRVKRLIANRPRFEVVLFDESATAQSMGQQLENGIKALYKWMNRGRLSFDWLVSEYQQGDGLGIGKEEFVPGHGASLAGLDPDILGAEDEGDEIDGAAERNASRAKYRTALAAIKPDKDGREALAYDSVVQDALHTELPPFRISAVDPLCFAYWDDGDGIAVGVERGKKSLNPLLETFKDYGLKVVNNRLIVENDGSEAVSGQTAPDYMTLGKDLSAEVKYVEIRTRHWIAILIEHPKIRGTKSAKGDRGVVLKFDNPFGPYTTGYVLIPGDVTTESEPADQFQPPILGLLNLAQTENILMTAQLSAAIEEALAPEYIQVTPDVTLPTSEADKSPEVKEGREIPMVQGEIKRVESPKTAVERIERRIATEQTLYQFQDALLGEATSDTSGHRLAVQVAQADIQAVPYQNARADAIVELMKGIVYAIRKHGLAVYIPTLPDSRREGSKLRVMKPAVITPDMADLNFDLLVTLGAETPVTKYARDQSLAQREQQGGIGYQTMMEQSDVEDPVAEIGRVFEGKLLKAVMEQTIPQLLPMLMQRAQQIIEQLGVGGMAPGTGLAGEGGANPSMADSVRLPGVNMPLTQQSSEGGPSVPESAEMGGVR